ncbi:MAG: hypothetical protein VXV86_06220, partial [Verrucomicrobiota bacterium]|nr:hypothetical protein [Verrucomicrobiota bacterium]
MNKGRRALRSESVTGLYSSFIANHVPGAKVKPFISGPMRKGVGNPPHLSCKGDCLRFAVVSRTHPPSCRSRLI